MLEAYPTVSGSSNFNYILPTDKSINVTHRSRLTTIDWRQLIDVVYIA
jgi:hypothetical protein